MSGDPLGDLPRPLVIRTEYSFSDRVYRIVAWGAGGGTLALLGLIGAFLLIYAMPAFRSQGWRFLTNTGFTTQGLHPVFGIGAALFWTVMIAVIAMVIALPISVASALFISEIAPYRVLRVIPVRNFLTALVDLMAAVPSIIYGLWGFFVLQGPESGVARWLSVHLGFIPIFKVALRSTRRRPSSPERWSG